jgi:DNA-binding transcriptional LysR family regulator
MDWNDLRYFLAAYRHRSLAGAARELECEYTTVGRRLAALEAALSTTLFIRTPEGLAPTPAANDLMPLAEHVERSVFAIELRATGHDDRAEGVVRVTCAEGFSAYIVDQLAALRAQHPKLVVEIIADLRPLDLARGEADIALRMGPTTQRELIERTLCVMSWQLFAAKDYVERRGAPDSVDNLRGHDIVGYDDFLAHVPGARWLTEHGDGATVVFRGNSLRAVIDAAVAGLGVTVLPYFLATRERLQLLAPDVLGTRALSIVVHPDLQNVARVRAVIDFLSAAILRDYAQGRFGPRAEKSS